MTKYLSQFSGGGHMFTPAMMQYDGASYQDLTANTAGNKWTLVCLIQRASFTGDTYERIFHSRGAAGRVRCWVRCFSTDYTTIPALAGCFSVEAYDSGNNLNTRLVIPPGYMDGNPHLFRVSVDLDNELASWTVDYQDALDTDHANHIAPTVDTLDTGSGGQQLGGFSGDGSANRFNGQIGFFAFDEQYFTDDDQIMFPDGTLRNADLSAWKIFNPHGDIRDNKGAWDDASVTGTIVVGDGGNGPHPLLGLNTDGDATAGDIALNKSAWVSGQEITGENILSNSLKHSYRIFDGSTNLQKTFTSSGQQQSMMCSVVGLPELAARRRIFRIESPSSYSNMSIEIYESNHGSIPNRMVFFQADSTNTGIFYFHTPDIIPTDEGLYNVFWTTDRSTGDWVIICNGEVFNSTGINDTGVHQTGANTDCVWARTASGTQHSKCGIGNMMYTDQYLPNWEDFISPAGDFQILDTSGWSQFGGNQPLVYAPGGRADVNNLGSLGAFTWSD